MKIRKIRVLERFAEIRRPLGDVVKWWAEHQAWPATDEIRIERRPSNCN